METEQRSRTVAAFPGLAALGFLTLVPLLIIVSSVDPEHGQGIAHWLGEGLDVSTASGEEVEELFTLPGQALQTTTAFGIAALTVFGLTFGAAVQTGYERVWDLPSARWWARWRHVGVVRRPHGIPLRLRDHDAAASGPAGGFAASLSAILFFWWSQRTLLGGRVARRALPGAVAIVIGSLGLRGFSRLVFSPLIASNAVTYGAFGTVLVIRSWLVGVGVVVFGGAPVGRVLHGELPRLSHALKRRR
ncbi:ribonuclease BN [Streptomyces halobius]|uniref:ribonuclease BN n=1 Tax=Streptomyces halobius TaxID=2879846 RepID=UPI0029E80C4A|nr:ribonuclease BN [Streptomyces halobius]